MKIYAIVQQLSSNAFREILIPVLDNREYYPFAGRNVDVTKARIVA